MSDDSQQKSQEEPGETEEAEQWDFYIQLVDGAPASIMLDFAFDGYAPMEGFGKLTMVFVDMESSGEQGTGDAAEALGFEPVELALRKKLEEQGAYFVGRVRHQKQWHLAFYSAADVELEAAAVSVLKEAERDHAVHVQDDANWDYYLQFLTPSGERRQWMADRDAVVALTDAGDPTEKPRAVDHWIYFQTSGARDAFVEALKAPGFAAKSGDEEADTEWKFPVTATREDAVNIDHIHKVTMQLKGLAETHDGWYDGWGCDTESE